MWLLILCCDLLILPIMILCGYLMYRHAPKEINSLCGYRTKRSMKNQDTWVFANQYCGRLWIRLGLLMILPSVLVHIPFLHSGEDALGILCVVVESLQIAVMLGSIYFVERALKRNFSEDGKPRQDPEIL